MEFLFTSYCFYVHFFQEVLSGETLFQTQEMQFSSTILLSLFCMSLKDLSNFNVIEKVINSRKLFECFLCNRELVKSSFKCFTCRYFLLDTQSLSRVKSYYQIFLFQKQHILVLNVVETFPSGSTVFNLRMQASILWLSASCTRWKINKSWTK